MSAAATMVSPSFPFPGPPPPPSPFSHRVGASVSNPTLQSGLISPPESRHTSGDEPPSVSNQSTRQSLPSISEALNGSDLSLPYPPHVPPPPPRVNTSDYFPPLPRSSVSDSHRPSVTSGPAPPPPPHSYQPSHPDSPYMGRGLAIQAPHTPEAQGDPYSRPPYPGQQPRLPALQPIKTDASPSATFRASTVHAAPHQSHPSPGYETPPHSARQQGSYAFSGYHPQSQGHQYSHPPAGPAPLYPAPPGPGPQQHGGLRSWENGHQDGHPQPHIPVAFYGESVKRHLDDFDLEASLNEVAECSGKMLEFTREYGFRTHGNQRAGLSPRSIPHLQTVEELMQKSRRIEDSLNRIREMVIAQNHAMEQQMKDSGRSGAGSYSDNGYPDERQGMGGFAGGDTKKRRGRAAPPGRCHSCNRAETPEWRRGPDGARTLCNACGLHYAKLTRKMGGKPQIGSSNLRPKSESEPFAS